jgi:hypothetical protein
MKYVPTQDQIQIIEDLIVERDALALSNQEFAKRHLPFDSSKWSRICAVLDPAAELSYFDMVQDRQSVFDDLALALREIHVDRERAAKYCENKIIATPEYKQVVQAVRDVRQKTSPERLIIYLAPTGGGKTFLCEYLRTELGASVVETREAWKRSYSTALQDICRSCRIRLANETVPSKMEDRMIDGLSSRTTVLAMDEGEFFGTAALNGIKLLLNKSRVTIVIAAIPEAYDKWNRYCPMEALQLSRRTYAIIESKCDVENVKSFFAGIKFENPKDSFAAIAKTANELGAYSLMRRVRDAISDDQPVSAEAVAKAITKSRRQMKRF